ncbi:MAG: undecaprenyl/decaprenyl-phosphate alpha-N-acetylglucosaminyl 1-phosphate transferase [Candidatus Moranbacteria bacterium]|jgi:UDP-GlcNAc:undecaprenyl-phosphate GlcNAc-1-phosphate transferase|nr:undecaprenyl/decaprenyl-phosphate alpha-N-acetylglucosaminyl 1-phosphate transferase [Candidatus Moranbacteria bacterium]
MSEQFLFPFLIAFILSVLLLSVVPALSRRFAGERNERDRTHKTMPRLGGVALIAAFLVAVLLNADLASSGPLFGLVAGSCLILLIGTLDDVFPLSWEPQLLFQVVLAGIIFFSGMRAWVLTNPFGSSWFLHPETSLFPSLFVGILFTLLIVNAMNWVDGVDGLLGGVSFSAFVTLFFVSLRPEVGQPTIAILASIFAGLSLGFLIYNVPPARLLAGTSGSYFLGFGVTALALFSGAKIATTLLVLSVPVLDACFVIVARIRAGYSPFRGGDERHLHDRLRNAGWSDRAIMMFFTLISVLSGVAALVLPATGKAFFLLALVAGFVFLVSGLGNVTKKEI